MKIARAIIFYLLLLFLALYGYYEREAIIEFFSGTEGESAVLYYEEEAPSAPVIRTSDDSELSGGLDGEDLKDLPE